MSKKTDWDNLDELAMEIALDNIWFGRDLWNRLVDKKYSSITSKKNSEDNKDKDNEDKNIIDHPMQTYIDFGD